MPLKVMTWRHAFRCLLPFVDWRKSIINVGLHRAIFLAKFLPVQDYRCFARPDGQKLQGNLAHAIAKQWISREDVIIHSEIPNV